MEYSYYLEILRTEGIARIDKTSNGNFIVNKLPTVTDKFFNQGGFKAVYDKQQEEVKIKEETGKMEFEKLKWDSQVSKFQAKTKWWPLIISLISIAISLIVLFSD